MKKFWALVAVCCISCFTLGCGETDTIEKKADDTVEAVDDATDAAEDAVDDAADDAADAVDEAVDDATE